MTVLAQIVRDVRRWWQRLHQQESTVDQWRKVWAADVIRPAKKATTR